MRRWGPARRKVWLRVGPVAALALLSACRLESGAVPQGKTLHTVEHRVAASTDDVEELPSGMIIRSSPDLELGDHEAHALVSLRFSEVDVPHGATITEAYVRFTADDIADAVTTLTIEGVAQDHVATFISARYNVSSQLRTVASARWTIPPWTKAEASGEAEQTVNLAPIIQEIIARPGWVRGNALALVFSGTGQREAKAFDSSRARAPRLQVSYVHDTRVVVKGFTARPSIARTVTYSWSIGAAPGERVSCSLDADGDSKSDHSFDDCLGNQTAQHTFGAEGRYRAKLTATSSSGSLSWATAEVQLTSPASVTVAAAGDIACDPTSEYFNGGLGSEDKCHMKATSDLLLRLAPDAVLALGDQQYGDATLEAYMKSYQRTWGRLKAITHPALGTHEFDDEDAAGYFAYFGAAAGEPSKGYYSFDLGAWHIVVLKSSCSNAGCTKGSPQEQWLRGDLAAHPSKCTLAVMHFPRFSSGKHGNNVDTTDLWQTLYAAGVELVLSGSDHDYERFAPQTPSGTLDTLRGIRQFVVGTGGKELYSFATLQPNSEGRIGNVYGVLELNLHLKSYDWRFVPEAGQTLSDRGSEVCH